MPENKKLSNPNPLTGVQIRKSLAERARINLNHIFIRKEYFGVWVIYKKKIGH
jgi:hypothetical protein